MNPDYTINLPQVDDVADKSHEAWMEKKREQGFTSRKAEDGEELMVPFDQLSEKQKDVDREMVKTIYKAIIEASKED